MSRPRDVPPRTLPGHLGPWPGVLPPDLHPVLSPQGLVVQVPAHLHGGHDGRPVHVGRSCGERVTGELSESASAAQTNKQIFCRKPKNLSPARTVGLDNLLVFDLLQEML